MRKVAHLRWYIVGMLFAATTISYIDRQNLTVVAPVLRDELGISNNEYGQIIAAFMLSYTIMQAVTGWLIDRLGTRNGFALIVVWWSVAGMMHFLGDSVVSFSIYRFLLGAGEAGSWAACVKAVSEWFPHKERGLANALWGSGTSAGLVISVPMVAWISITFGWQFSFLITGTFGFVWVAVWMWIYRLPDDHPRVTQKELAHIRSGMEEEQPSETAKIPYISLLKSRNVWAVILARVLADPCTWFYHYWIPEFLKRNADFSLADIGKYAWIPFLAQGIGIVLGGMISDRLYRSGMNVITARLTTMLMGMILMSVGVLAGFQFSVVISFVIISTATFGFGLWAPNMMTLCGEAFPRPVIGSVTGLAGMGAGLGGMGFMLLTGWTLDHFSYTPVFIVAGIVPLLAFATLFVLFDRKRASDIASSERTVL